MSSKELIEEKYRLIRALKLVSKLLIRKILRIEQPTEQNISNFFQRLGYPEDFLNKVKTGQFKISIAELKALKDYLWDIFESSKAPLNLYGYDEEYKPFLNFVKKYYGEEFICGETAVKEDSEGLQKLGEFLTNKKEELV